MKKLGVRIAVLALGVIPSATLLAQAAAAADVPDNSGTNRASTHSPVIGDSVWNDPSVIGDGGRRLG